MARTRFAPLVATLSFCAAVFVAGLVLVVLGSGESSPEATPTPLVDVSISPEEARDLAEDEPGDGAAELVEPPPGDLGPYVRTDPVQSVWSEVVAGDRTDNLPADMLVVPSLPVEASIVREGVEDGAMSLPADLADVGLLETTSALDADTGSSLIAGHVTQGGNPGALFLLGLAEPGASVVTTDAEGRATVWAITSITSYNKQKLPKEIFETSGERRLVLVTCGGEVVRTDDGRWTHEDNIVVTAVPMTGG
ncbi:class F sortase [Brachybacterium saurashtrense]|uniref:Class F sortase n=1 Tax=Brachybacterium saurashtrense TaxID=556288 RepID=A0A345YS62_9MICO|nr:class F sortase [Brachybacterium saurashtrense]AXK46764.1 class F sortase [Brachybacterium saurashtrense]RRR22479.1 class F sortase [Brachybacterium saurashtrense]